MATSRRLAMDNVNWPQIHDVNLPLIASLMSIVGYWKLLNRNYMTWWLVLCFWSQDCGMYCLKLLVNCLLLHITHMGGQCLYILILNSWVCISLHFWKSWYSCLIWSLPSFTCQAKASWPLVFMHSMVMLTDTVSSLCPILHFAGPTSLYILGFSTWHARAHRSQLKVGLYIDVSASACSCR